MGEIARLFVLHEVLCCSDVLRLVNLPLSRADVCERQLAKMVLHGILFEHGQHVQPLYSRSS